VTSDAIRLPDASSGGDFEIQVRARAEDGTVSDWATSWLRQPGDDTDFTASAAWTRVTGPTLYRGSALKSTKRGARLTLPIAGINFDLVATTCASCGRVRVSITRTSEQEEDAEVMAPDPVVIDLGSRKMTTRRLLDVFFDDSDDAVWGTVQIEVLSCGKPVVIDGYVVE
jgi:3D (Asp-Asp-Asp) domain-containing protein